MKKTAILFLVLVLIVSAFCGCTNRKNEIVPTTSPIVTTTPGDEIIKDDEVMPDVEDGVITDENTEDGVIKDDNIKDDVITNDKNETLPAEGEKNTAG